MRFGSVDMFTDFGEWGFRMGRPIANEGFLKALLTYGTFDTYEFFCPDVYHMEQFSERVRDLIGDSHLLSRVKASLQIALAESVQSEKYDVFHLGDFTYFMPYLVDIRNRYAQHPFPITGVTHSLDAVRMNLRYLELILAGLAPFDGIVCTSDAARRAVEKGLSRALKQLADKSSMDLTAKARLECIPLGIDDAFFEESDKASARAYFKIPDNMIVALSVGRLSLRQKADWSPVLELLTRMYSSKNIENLIVMIAGGAEESDISLLESLIARFGLERRVLLFPNFTSEAKTKLYQAADFYISIVDNFQETFGLNIVEAMASGLPVVASDFSGYRELVTDNENGFLIPTSWSRALPKFLMENLGILDPSVTKLYLSQMVAVDLDALQQAIMTLHSDADLRTRMGLVARRSAQTYHWENVIHSYESFWADLSKEAGKAGPSIGRTGACVLAGDFSRTFSHYPSKIMDDDDLVSLTEVGRNTLEKSTSFVRYEDVAACLFPELETFILQMLSQGTQSVGSIKKQVANRLEATEGQTEFHLLWLLKHGALAFKPTEK